MRIVSLLPSATEMLCLLGLEDQLVGVTHECDYPPGVGSLPKVTQSRVPQQASSRAIDEAVRDAARTNPALYALDVPLLEALHPDLLVTQCLCEVCAVAEEEVRRAADSIASRPSVVDLAPMQLSEVLECIRQLGQATGREQRAESEIAKLSRRIEAVAKDAADGPAPRVVMLEWLDPLFCAGHWNPELIQLAGGHEVVGVAGRASREITGEQLAEAQPDVLLIACCGLGVERTLQDLHLLRQQPLWRQLPCVGRERVYVFDGSAYFNRPGPRLVDSLEMAAYAINPDRSLSASPPKSVFTVVSADLD